MNDPALSGGSGGGRAGLSSRQPCGGGVAGLRARGVLVLGLVLGAAGCAVHPKGPIPVRPQPFQFGRDTVGFTNETRWIYVERPDGGMTGHSRDQAPAYSLRCFVVARMNRQFFDHAVFRPGEPRVPPEVLRARLREVMGRSRRTPSGTGPGERVEIPGFRDLRELSEAHGDWLRADGGAAFESYFQRGHWRMLFPFWPAQQVRVAERLVSDLADGRPRVLHLVRFPQLSINHAVLVHGVRPMAGGWEFSVADPNDPDQAQRLLFDAERREFRWPRVPYFPGGKVHAYEVYRNSWY